MPEKRLLKRGLPVGLENQPLQILAALLDRPGEMVSCAVAALLLLDQFIYRKNKNHFFRTCCVSAFVRRATIYGNDQITCGNVYSTLWHVTAYSDASTPILETPIM